MKMMNNFTLFVFMLSSYLIACDSDQTDVGGTCYNTVDLDVLVAFASNSGFSTDYEDVINMWETQTWNSDRRLTQLICNGCDLKGAIPSEIGNLTELTALFLQNNELEGSIPEGIGNLTQLSTLWLNDNLLTGIIPSEIINLNNLTMLLLYNNSLTGIIPNALCDLESIFSIDLSDNNFCSPYPSCLESDEIGAQEDVSDCNCSEGFITPDAVDCYSQNDLDVLVAFASNSGLSSEYADVITLGNQDWNSDGRFTSWICTNCMISGPIPSEIGTLSELSFLNLGGNSLTGNIPLEIGNLTELTTIRLHDNSLTGNFPEEIFSLIELTELNFHDNDLSGEISSMIGNLNKLETLNLHANNFSGNLPSEIGSLMELNKVYLYENSFTGSIPQEYGNLVDASILNFHTNTLSGLIPDSFCNLSNVNDLRLDQNNFCPPYPDCMIEEEVGSQDNDDCEDYCASGETSVLDEGYIGCYDDGDLQFLQDLISMSIGNDKPPSELDPWKLGYQVWENRRLESFCCSNKDISNVPGLENSIIANNFSNCDEDCPYAFNTEIPSSIGNLNQLDTLLLIGMNFNGIFPSEITSLANLDVLFLSDNENLTGSLPSDIGNINELKHLSLENNDLIGEIPISLWSLSTLLALNLSDNRFEGSLPSDIDYSSFQLLRWFDIENNNFFGFIPDEICNLNFIDVVPFLDYFIFDENLFCPPFPDCINTNNENQNATLVSYYEDANQDTFGNPDVECVEQYCEDYPPIEGDCAGYVSNNSDLSDACPNGEIRDECGECGGDGFIANCIDGLCQNMDCNGDCKMETLFGCSGSGCGTAVIDDCGVCASGLSGKIINADFDACDICYGPNIDCSSGYNAQTCPAMDEYCGSCTGNPVCLPRLDYISQGQSTLIDINTSSINFHFTVPINYQTDGIELESHDGTDITFTVSSPENDEIELVLDEPLISNDQVEISFNPCKIKSHSNLNIFNEEYCLDDGDDIPEFIDENIDDIVLNVALMGDFDMNGEVNQYDLDELLQVWKTEDFSYEIGPWEGTAPYLQAMEFGYDEDYDIHDLMGFVQMWNWDHETNGSFRKMESSVTMDYELPFNVIENQMVIHFQDYPGDMKRVWFQLKLDDSDIQLENLLSFSDFDVVLNEFDEIQGIHDWVLGSFTPINDKTINLFKIHSQIEGLKSLVLEYEIIGFDGEVSHGEINFTHDTMPEKIFINAPYPNPFNPVTKIAFGVPGKSNAFMEVHDIQGRLIEDRVMLNLEPGFHAFIWNGIDQPSGIYLIRIKINDRVENFRTMLIK